MDKNQLISISEFAKISGITRSNLIFYDKEDVLKPMERQKNNYRLYSYLQLDLASIITSLRQMGLSLDEIKLYIQNRTPETVEDVFTKQVHVLDNQINQLLQMKEIMTLYIENMRQYKDIKIPTLEVMELEEEIICLGPDINKMENKVNSVFEFIQLCRENDIRYVNHTGRYFTKEKIKNHDWTLPNHYYLRNSQGDFQKEKGLYLVLIEKNEGSHQEKLYKKMMKYIKDNHLEICGNTYEEYILDELSVKSPKDYVIKITIHVKHK